MLEVKNVSYLVKIHGNWVDLGYSDFTVEEGGNHVRDYECKVLRDFAKLEKHGFKGIHVDYTAFRHRPYVTINDLFRENVAIRVEEKDLNLRVPYHFREVYTVSHPTMSWLVNNLTADEFMEYSQDRHWGNLIITKE